MLPKWRFGPMPLLLRNTLSALAVMLLFAPFLTACQSSKVTQKRIDALEAQLAALSKSYVRLSAQLEKESKKIALLYDNPQPSAQKAGGQASHSTARPPDHLTVVKLTPESAREKEEQFAPAPPPVGVRPQKLLKEADAAYARQEFDDAEVKYLKFLNYFPKHSMAAQAIFRLGEIRFKANDYQGAAQFYNDAIERFPNNEIIPDAFLQLATAQQNMHQDSEAIETLCELIDSYPDTIATKKARVRLMQLAVTEE